MVPVGDLSQLPISPCQLHSLSLSLSPLPAPNLPSTPLCEFRSAIQRPTFQQRAKAWLRPAALRHFLITIKSNFKTNRQPHPGENERVEARGEGGREKRERQRGERQSERGKKNPTQHSQASGPESLPLLWNQKHLLIACKRQRGSVSLSAAVIPHSDEHLKCQDPFQQLCTSNQALSSVTVILQPLQLGPHDSSPHCVWRQGMFGHTKQAMSLEGVC